MASAKNAGRIIQHSSILPEDRPFAIITVPRFQSCQIPSALCKLSVFIKPTPADARVAFSRSLYDGNPGCRMHKKLFPPVIEAS
jgi:hypothetical protein